MSILAEIVDTSDEWISTRTGIKERRISEGENTSDMATKQHSKLLKFKISSLRISILLSISDLHSGFVYAFNTLALYRPI